MSRASSLKLRRHKPQLFSEATIISKGCGLKENLDNNKTIYVIDGSSFLYRAYYSMRPLTTKSGMHVQAVYGFCRMIKKIIDSMDPKYLIIAWDSKGKTVRHLMYPEYKATRQAAPNDLFEQKELIQEFATTIKLCQLQVESVEADDLMYSITKDITDANFILITSDKDMGQMISENIFVYDPFKEDYLTETVLEQKYGITISKLPFYYALIGDSSDNIPGVKGVGPKTAQDIVNKFDNLDDLYANLHKIENNRIKLLLQEHKNNAYLSYDLFLLKYYKTNLKKEDLIFDKNSWFLAKDFFKKLDFTSLLKDFPNQEQVNILSFGNNNYILVDNETKFKDFIAELSKSKIFAVDTETDGLSPLLNKLVGISFCVQEGTAYYIPVAHDSGDQLAKDFVISQIKPILENPDIKKIMHSAKFDMLVLVANGINVQGLVFDTLIAASVVSKEGDKLGLKFLSEKYLNQPMLTYKQIVTDRKLKSFAQVVAEEAVQYAAADAHQTFLLKNFLEQQLESAEQRVLFYDIEMPLCLILLDMEKNGILLDKESLLTLGEKLDREIKAVKNLILDLIGHEYIDINLNSPKQLENLLFYKLNLPVQKKTAQKTAYSTDNEVLAELAKIHPVPSLIIKYREFFKLKVTYVEGLLEHINPKTQSVHTAFNQTSVATGRLASSDPNLQNIPVESGQETIRSVFLPQKGHLFISADYSQIELRVLAYLSQDQNLLNAFWVGHDIHASTAAGLFDIGLHQVTNDQRQVGKRINFSILYGLTAFGLKSDLDISFYEAELYINRYFKQYPGVLAWMEKVIEQAKLHGYVKTYWGKKRYVSGIYERNRALYDAARRIAINTIAQGTAAELMKLGMIALKKEFSKNYPDAKMVLQIHDELLISVPENLAQELSLKIADILEKVVTWNVPLKVTTRVGKNWQEVTK